MRNAPGCEVCGRPCRVRILEKYQGGSPVFVHYCLQCADSEDDRPSAPSPAAVRRLSAPILVAIFGCAVGLFGLLRDALPMQGDPGITWLKLTVLFAGSVLVFGGAVLRTDLVGAIGTVLAVGAIASNWIGLPKSGGFGLWQQVAVMGAALLLVTAGVLQLWTRLALSELRRA